MQQIWIPLSAEESKKILTLASVFKLNQDSRQIWRIQIFIFVLVNNYSIMFLNIHSVGQSLSDIAFVFYKSGKQKSSEILGKNTFSTNTTLDWLMLHCVI